MKEDYKEEAIKQKLLKRGFSKEKLLNNRGLIGATINECLKETRYHPDTLEPVEKPKFFDNWYSGKHPVWDKDLPAYKEHKNALTLEQVFERYKEMKEELKKLSCSTFIWDARTSDANMCLCGSKKSEH